MRNGSALSNGWPCWRACDTSTFFRRTIRYWGMCERADEYDAAKNELARRHRDKSAARLLYAWSSVERVLPAAQDAGRSRPSCATTATGTGPARPSRMPSAVDQRSRALRLRRQAPNGPCDAESRACGPKRPLQGAGQVRPWRSSGSLLLSLGNAMRNVPARGAVTLPGSRGLERGLPFPGIERYPSACPRSPRGDEGAVVLSYAASFSS